MTVQHFTNDEVAIENKRVGWASTYMQARTKAVVNGNETKFPRIDNPHEAFVFWPMTESGVRGSFVVVNERLYDQSNRLNEAALRRLAG